LKIEDLKFAFDNSLIDAYEFQNAESLTHPDDSFDFVLCHQAFHHFKKPLIGLYEMIKVSKIAVAICEPNDFYPSPFFRSFLKYIKDLIRRFLKYSIKHHNTGNYEVEGNYVYGISLREIEKICLSLNLHYIFFKYIDDYWAKGMDQELEHDNGPLLRTYRKVLLKKYFLSKLRLNKPNNISVVIFKKQPTLNVVLDYEKIGFKLIRLPSSPY